MADKSQPLQVIVSGDTVVDWNIAEGDPHSSRGWTASKASGIWSAPGGAGLLAALIRAMPPFQPDSPGAGMEVFAPHIPAQDLRPEAPRYHHAYHLLAEYGGEAGLGRWRAARFLGFDLRKLVDPPHPLEHEPSDPALILLDDANLGFRNREGAWPKSLSGGGGSPAILLKQAAPVAQGALWERLVGDFSEGLTIVTTIDDLRRSAVQISRQISWERTAQDVYWELVHNPRVNRLVRCAHVVISLGAAGAILISGSPEGGLEGRLLFDPCYMEGEWERKWPGTMYGYTSSLAAALAHALASNPADPDLRLAIQAGVRGMRALLQEGFGIADIHQADAELTLPLDSITQAFFARPDLLSEAQIQDPVFHLLAGADRPSPRVMPGYWTILEDCHTRDLTRLAQRVVVEGPSAVLQGVPIGQFGALTTVDRREIEALRGVRALITEYLERPREQPLSIAVFGPPGSGKSFAVKQISKSAAAGEIQPITFNMSQLDRPEALLDAFHQVRDIRLSGAVPLVFWDEFDTPLSGEPLGWLKYFLSPMQDGEFRQGQISHPIGRAIFAFAGGTCHRMQDFGRGLREEERRAAKLPDFISRLKGFIDILGPNPLEDVDDPYFIIRRAIILRSLFERHTPQLISSQDGDVRVRVDPGVLRALLETERFRHGVRSMETLLTMSRLAGASSYDRSCLPPEDQLNLHGEGTDFLAKVQQLDLEGETLETLSRAAHEVFCEALIEKGYSYGPETDEGAKTHRALLPYGQLSEQLKESNRENVRDIPNKLAAAGYVMLPARSDEPPFDFPGADLERLARMEHDRWSDSMRRAGWRHGGALDEERKAHPALIPWEELPEHEREKDREMVRSIPRILARAGYAILVSHHRP
jgi:hypothetical protein